MAWAKYLDCKYTDLNFAEASELKAEPEEEQEETKEVNLEGIRVLRKVVSEGPVPDLVPQFARGDEVTVVRRVTWRFPLKGNPNWRKDLGEGTTGVVQGWGDLEQRQVLLTVVLDVPDAENKEITSSIYPICASSSPQSTCWNRVLGKESLQVPQASRLNQQSLTGPCSTAILPLSRASPPTRAYRQTRTRMPSSAS